MGSVISPPQDPVSRLMRWCSETKRDHTPNTPPPGNIWMGVQPHQSPDGPRCDHCTANDPFVWPTVYWPCVQMVSARVYWRIITQYKEDEAEWLKTPEHLREKASRAALDARLADIKLLADALKPAEPR